MRQCSGAVVSAAKLGFDCAQPPAYLGFVGTASSISLVEAAEIMQ